MSNIVRNNVGGGSKVLPKRSSQADVRRGRSAGLANGDGDRQGRSVTPSQSRSALKAGRNEAVATANQFGSAHSKNQSVNQAVTHAGCSVG